MTTIDLNTTEGIAAHVRTMTDAELERLAASTSLSHIVFAAAAEGELIVRRSNARTICYHREHCGATAANPCRMIRRR